MDDTQGPVDQTEAENLLYCRPLVLRTEDWRLWRIKCKVCPRYLHNERVDSKSSHSLRKNISWSTS